MTNLKALFALILGLVFQLAQVQAGVSAQTSPRVEEKSCCTNSCPCIRDNSSEQRQAPATPAPQVMKIIAVRSEGNDPLTFALLPSTSVEGAGAEVEFQRFTGYPGVALSVAFCRYLM